MNKWQLTGVIQKDPEYHADPREPATEIMNFTIKNTEKYPDGRKWAVWCACVWRNPDAESRRLFKARALVLVEGYGHLAKVKHEDRLWPTMAMAVIDGEYIRQQAEVPVIG